jgi:acyl transferase domain-containing protein
MTRPETELLERLRSAHEVIGRLRAALAEARTATTLEPIAIVGIAVRYPGADDTEELWELVRDGRDAIALPSPARARGVDHGAVGGFLQRIDEFDPAFFGMTSREARQADPQLRLFLELAWHAIENAAYTRDQLRGTRCGVFVGAARSGYHTLARGEARDEHLLAGNVPSMIASRTAHHLGVTGPCLTLDTACSSSLTAIHLACQQLRAGEIDVALAGGVNLQVLADSFANSRRAGLLSIRGRSLPFLADGDGLVLGEGGGAVVLTTLAHARASGRNLHAIIRASGMNQGGGAQGVTVPSDDDQSRLQLEVIRRSGIDARSIGYVEAHGTASAIGDAVEVAALRRTFDVLAPGATWPCALGSVKANLGNAEHAAGMAALAKVILALQHATLPPLPGLGDSAPRPEVAAAGFHLPRTAEPWRAPAVGVRCAAVSGFGLNGTNVHVLVEEAAPVTAAPVASPLDRLFVLSAPDPERAAAHLRRMARFVRAARDRDRGDDFVARLCATLQLGREHFPHRVAIVFETPDELVERLTDLAAFEGQAPVEGAIDGIFGSPPPVEAARSELEGLARTWVAGGAVDFARADAPVPLSLPPRPLRRVPCWLDTSAAAPASISVVRQAPERTRAGVSEYLRRRIEAVTEDTRSELDTSRSFYELGLDSIMIAELVTTLEADLGVSVSDRLADLFRSPTLDALIDLVIGPPAPRANEGVRLRFL